MQRPYFFDLSVRPLQPPDTKKPVVSTQPVLEPPFEFKINFYESRLLVCCCGGTERSDTRSITVEM